MKTECCFNFRLALSVKNGSDFQNKTSVARSSGFSRKIPDFPTFSGFFPGSGFFRILDDFY
jgi:hypothetical protein